MMQTAEQNRADGEARRAAKAAKLAELKAAFAKAEDTMCALPGEAQPGYDAAVTKAAGMAYDAAKQAFMDAYRNR